MGCDPARVEEAVDTFCEDAILSAKRCNELEEENTRLREERGDDDPDVYYRSCPRCKGSGQAYGVQGASLPGIECCVTPGYTTCPECSGTGRQRR
jgi:DnaJ-class molecular chaperone